MRTIRHVACDWDGCGGPQRSDAVNLEAMLRLQQLIHDRQIPFALMTGRGQDYAEFASQMLCLMTKEHPPHICESGGIMFDMPHIPSTHPDIDLDKVLPALAACETAMREYGMVRETAKQTCLSLNPQGGGSVEELATDETIRSVLDQICAESGLIQWSNTHSAIDVTPKGIDKGTGLVWHSQVTGIPLSDYLVLGDSTSDIAGMRVAVEAGGFCGCPSNANDKVKAFVSEHKGMIAGQPTTAGVVQILMHCFA